MPVDTSMYAVPQVQAPNLLGMVGQFAQAQNALNQNMLFQQQFKARQAIGPILQQSINPDSGEIDYNKFISGLASHPDAAYMAPDIAAQAVQRQLTQSDILLKTLDAEAKKQSVIGNAAASLLPLKQNVTLKDLASRLTEPDLAVHVGPKQAAELIANLSAQGIKGGPQLYNWLQQRTIMAQGATEGLKSVYGTVQSIGAGGQTRFVQTNPIFGGTRDVGGVAHTLTPQERSAPVEQLEIDEKTGRPTGGKVMKPRQEAMPTYTGTGEREIPPGPSQLAKGGEITGINVQNIPPGAPLSTRVPTQSITQGPGGAPQMAPTSVPTKLAPTQEKYLTDLGANMADHEKNLNESVGSANSTMLQIGAMQDALKEAKTGGGTAARAKLAQLAQAAGMPTKTVDQIASGNLGAIQYFEKQAVPLATAALRAQFAGSTSKFTQMEWQRFQESNPNLDTDPRAIEKMFAFAKKIYHLQSSEQKALNLYKQTGEPIDQFPAWWNSRLQKSGWLPKDDK